MATKHIAHWATNLEYKHLPAEVIEAAIKSFYNWTGCAIGGSDHEATRLAVRPDHSLNHGPTDTTTVQSTITILRPTTSSPLREQI